MNNLSLSKTRLFNSVETLRKTQGRKERSTCERKQRISYESMCWVRLEENKLLIKNSHFLRNMFLLKAVVGESEGR